MLEPVALQWSEASAARLGVHRFLSPPRNRAKQYERGTTMKLKLSALVMMLAIGANAPLAEAKGCVKGAAVGGIAGHVAGGHGVAGAAIGCAVGHHRAKVKAKQPAQTDAAANASAANSASTRVDDSTTDLKKPAH
jgi:hypothetical protein